MAGVSAAIGAQVAMTQQAIALEVLKQSANVQQELATMLQQSVANVPASSTLGTNVDLSA